jgi:titin
MLEQRLLLAAQIVGSATVYSTIQAAVDAANAGDTVVVDAGTYPEQVVVSQSITIEGAQAGVDARSGSRINGSAPESIVTGATSGSVQTSAFYIDANDVTIDGFTVQGETNPSDNFGAGIVIAAGQSGTHIINNIVQHNVSGLFLANDSSSDPALIQHNVFRNNNNAGENGGRGIYTDENISGGNLTGVSIDSNIFTGNFGGTGTTNLEAAVALEADVAGAQSNISITNNVMNSNGKAALILNATNITFSGNTVTGCQDQYSGSIRFEGNVQNVTLDDNDVDDNWGPAVAVDSKGAAGDNSGFVLNNNDFYNNNAAYSVPISVVYFANNYDGVFNAENNWWGSVSGPSGDATGSGDAVSAGVFQSGGGLGWALLPGGNTAFSPWSTSPNTTNISPPTAPAALKAVANSATQVTLTWTDTAAGIENGFVVQRSLDGTNFANVGATGAGVTSFVDKTAAPLTSYTYRVYATGSVGNSLYSTAAMVTTPANLLAPTALTATAISSTQVNLAWTDTDAGVETGFMIQRSSAGGAYAQVGTAARGVTTFSNTALTAGTTYSYRVEAEDSTGGVSPVSNIATATTPVVISAPSALTATAVSATQVNLAWHDNAAGVETGFLIQRSTAGGAFAQIGTTAKGATAFSNTALTTGTAYTYRVEATAAGGSSAWSPVATVTTPLAAAAPSALTAAAVSSTQVNLAWHDNAAGVETGFIIQRSTAGGAFAQIGTTGKGIVAFSDTTVLAGTSYMYRVAANSAGGASAWSTAAAVATAALPAAPTGVLAVAVSPTQVKISWTDAASATETGFIVERSVNAQAFVEIATTAARITSFVDSNVSPGTPYAYRVQTIATAGASAYSAVANITTHLPAAAPTGLVASGLSQTQVHLSWADTAGGIETGFIVQRGTNGTTFAQIGTTLAGATSYVDTAAAAKTTYYYRIEAASAGGNSPACAAVKFTTAPLPSAPASLSASAKSATLITLAWVHPAATFDTGSIIQRSTDGITFTQIATIAPGVLAYSDPTALPGLTYTYRVAVTSPGGNSAWSPLAKAKTATVAKPTLAAAPANLKAVATAPTAVAMTWTNTSGAATTGFIIQRSTDGVHFTQIGTTAGNVISYSDKTASPGVSYTYRVQATSTAGVSAVSKVAAVKTPTAALPPVAKAPASLKVVAASSTQLDLSWSNPAGSTATGFIIQRSTDGVHFTQIGMTAGNLPVYIDRTAVAGTTYTYRVQAISAGGDSAFSNSAAIKAPALAAPHIATAPAALKAAVASSTLITLAWTDTAFGIETGFVIERAVDGVHFSPIATTATAIHAYSDHNVATGVTYTYRIRALSAGGTSGYSNLASAKA